jgi:hypothetical protein
MTKWCLAIQTFFIMNQKLKEHFGINQRAQSQALRASEANNSPVWVSFSERRLRAICSKEHA